MAEPRLDTLIAPACRLNANGDAAKWLADKMPRWRRRRHGRPRKFGSRRHCFSHEGYAQECDRTLSIYAASAAFPP
jgi:beta-galactosidase